MKKMQNELANPSVDSHDNCYVESLVVHFAKAWWSSREEGNRAKSFFLEKKAATREN